MASAKFVRKLLRFLLLIQTLSLSLCLIVTSGESPLLSGSDTSLHSSNFIQVPDFRTKSFQISIKKANFNLAFKEASYIGKSRSSQKFICKECRVRLDNGVSIRHRRAIRSNNRINGSSGFNGLGLYIPELAEGSRKNKRGLFSFASPVFHHTPIMEAVAKKLPIKVPLSDDNFEEDKNKRLNTVPPKTGPTLTLANAVAKTENKTALANSVNKYGGIAVSNSASRGGGLAQSTSSVNGGNSTNKTAISISKIEQGGVARARSLADGYVPEAQDDNGDKPPDPEAFKVNTDKEFENIMEITYVFHEPKLKATNNRRKRSVNRKDLMSKAKSGARSTSEFTKRQFSNVKSAVLKQKIVKLK